MHRLERSSGGGDTDILLKVIFNFFLSQTVGKSPIPSKRAWKFLQATQQINSLTFFELNGVSFGLLLSLALGVEEITLTRTSSTSFPLSPSQTNE